MREAPDHGNVGGDDEWTGRGCRTVLGRVVGELELVGVVRDDHADEQDAKAVEEEDTVECEADGLGDGTARVLRLASCHTDKLSTQVGKGGVDHDRPEAQEASERASRIRFELGKCARVLPVTEPDGVASRATAAGDDEREEDDADNDNDLE